VRQGGRGEADSPNMAADVIPLPAFVLSLQIEGSMLHWSFKKNAKVSFINVAFFLYLILQVKERFHTDFIF